MSLVKSVSLMTNLISSLLLLLSLNVKAEVELSIAPSLLYFDYTEFSTGGTVLDNESGWMPGVQFQINKEFSSIWEVEIELGIYGGNVDYSGHTQAGNDHSTTTDETVYVLGANVKTPLTTAVDLIFGLKDSEWKRDINDNNGIYGLLEIYRWNEISAGIATEFLKTETQTWRVEASLLRIINPTLHVDLSRADYGTTDLNLGEEWGGRLRLSWLHEHAPNWQYDFNIFYEGWSFGRSNSRATTGGVNSGTFYEPYSETQYVGVQLIITKSF